VVLGHRLHAAGEATRVVRISLVVPTFNPGPVLERALTSLINQGHPDLQLIVADSQSGDATRALLERYRPALGVLLVEKDRGQADGLNRGFQHATGDVFGWLCADDELLPGAIAHVADMFSRHPEADVLVGRCERVFADGTTTVTPARHDTWEMIGIQNVVDQPSVFWRSRLHRRVGQLDEEYHLAFDWDFWCRMRDSGARLITSDRVLSRYHFTETNKSGNAGRQHVRESFRIVKRYGPLHGLLANVFMILYRLFDLHGCYDRPPTCTRVRRWMHRVVLGALCTVIGQRLTFSYNWHFASCQERGLKWW
jgi:glycosyltransferase involved in cell wall biosynthesis